MMVKLLVVEDIREKDDLHQNPSWEVVSGFIRRLDGTTVTYMALYKTENENNDEYFLVGGGGEFYICEYVNGGQSHHLLANDDAKSNEMVSLPVKNTSKFPRKYCATYEKVLPSVKYFYEHGGMNPEYKWDSNKRKQ